MAWRRPRKYLKCFTPLKWASKWSRWSPAMLETQETTYRGFIKVKTPAPSIMEQAISTTKTTSELLVTAKLTQRLTRPHRWVTVKWPVGLSTVESVFTRSSNDTSNRRYQPVPSISRKPREPSLKLGRFKVKSQMPKGKLGVASLSQASLRQRTGTQLTLLMMTVSRGRAMLAEGC